MNGKNAIKSIAEGALMLPCLAILAACAAYPVIGAAKAAALELASGASGALGAEFLEAAAHTLAFSAAATAATLALGLYLAAQFEKLPLSNALGTFLALPALASGAVVATAASLAGQTAGGAPWTGAAGQIARALAIDIWWQTGLAFVILQAALRKTPRQVLEAARMEGASSFTIFWRVRFPKLLPLLGLLAAIKLALSLREFDLLIAAGPSGAQTVQTLSFHTQAAGNSGAAQTQALALAALAACLAAPIFLALRRARLL